MSEAPQSPRTEHDAETPVRRRLRIGDSILSGTTVLVSVGLVALLAGLLWVLEQGAAPALMKYGLNFFTSRQWDPVNDRFGALPYIYGLDE